MKKIYILAALVAFAFTTNAQIIDDEMEFYDLGEMGAQNPAVWSVWSGTPTGPSGEDLIVTDDEANSGTQSGFVGDGGAQDVLLLLGNQDAGTYTLEFQMYIPAGKTGYFNLQGETENGGANGGTGIFNSPNLVFNNTQSANGAPGLGGAYPNIADPDPTYSWAYPEDEWFTVSIFYDIAGPTWQMTVAGDAVDAQPFDADGIIGGVDFFSIDGNNTYYIDDVLFVEGTLGNDEFSAANFSVYPNPVQDRLNIQSTNTVDAVVVYDVLGKVVLSTTPGAVSPSIDMSNLSSGAYLVNITIDGASKTVKVIK